MANGKLAKAKKLKPQEKKLKPKGYAAYKSILTVKQELSVLIEILERVQQKLSGVMENYRDLFEEIGYENAGDDTKKIRSILKGIPDRLEFVIASIPFYIDFTVEMYDNDELAGLNGRIIYGAVRSHCFQKCIHTDIYIKPVSCERVGRCDHMEDMPSLSFLIDKQGVIQSKNNIDGVWNMDNDEQLLDMHLRAIEFIWKRALEWCNEPIMA